MDKYTQTLPNLTWTELLQQISAILARDYKSLESSVNYYKKLLGDSKADKDQINRLFEKLQIDQLRYQYFSELFFRLDNGQFKVMITSLESCIQQETQIQNFTPKDWTATIHCMDGKLKVYFMALSYNH